MRNILTTTKSGLSAIAAVGRRTCLAAMLATSLSATSGGFAIAQSPYGTTQSLSLADSGEQSYGLVSGGGSLDDSDSIMTGSMPIALQGGAMNSRSPVTGSGRSTNRVPATLASMPTVMDGGGYYEGGAVSGCNPCFTPGCDVSWYIGYEALWLRREGDENFSLTQFTRMPEFDYELGEFGGRITAGRLFDCTNGIEGVYTGPYKWRRTANVTGPGNLDSRFFPTDGLDGGDIDSFNDANQHVQTYETRFSSYEVNRTWWTWDVLQTMVGLRYIDYEEDYLLSTARVGVGNGAFRSSINNSAVGPQIGALLMRPVSLRANYGFRGKAAVFANFDEVSSFLSNAGTVVLNANDNAVDLAGLVEMGVFANYQIVPSVRLTAGYEFMYLPGFATVPGQNYSNLTPSTGSSVENDDEVFLHGGSVGVQILY